MRLSNSVSNVRQITDPRIFPFDFFARNPARKMPKGKEKLQPFRSKWKCFVNWKKTIHFLKSRPVLHYLMVPTYYLVTYNNFCECNAKGGKENYINKKLFYLCKNAVFSFEKPRYYKCVLFIWKNMHKITS